MKTYAFYCHGENQEFADYYFLQLFFYCLEELELHPGDCDFFIDVGNKFNQKNEMMNRINNYQAIIVPSFTHLNPNNLLFKEIYEDEIRRKGVYLIYLDEEGFNYEGYENLQGEN